MSEINSYPSPDAAREGGHPFYTSQHPMLPAEHSQHPQTSAGVMQGGNNTISGYAQAQQSGQNVQQAHPSTPQQLAQRGLDVGPRQDHNNPDSTSRKRSKVSRACDECRRKKIRCDAESESPGIQCSACRRSGQVCEFSRAPQKRGPSKGYIKELAERVNMLEYRSGATPPEMQYVPPMQDPSASFLSPLGQNGRKRVHDVIEAPDNFQTLQGYNNGHSQLEHLAARHPSMQHDSLDKNNQGPRVHPNTNAQSQSPNMHVIQPTDYNTAFEPPGWRSMYAKEVDDLLEKYYSLIHPTLPLLPHAKEPTLRDLEDIPEKVVEAFLEALNAAITSLTDASNASTTKRAAELLVALQVEEPGSRGTDANTIYLQALILMALATENSGPSRNRNTSWFNQAVSIASFMKLQFVDAIDYSAIEVADSYINVGRRAWLALVVLDRFRAAGTCGPLLIREDNVDLLPDDRDLFGNSAYYLIRVTFCLGHVSDANIYHHPQNDNPSRGAHVVRRAIHGMVSSLEMSIVEVWGMASTTAGNMYLPFLYLRLLARRYNELFYPKTQGDRAEVVDVALEMVRLLLIARLPNTRSEVYPVLPPLIHHFAALASITLAETKDQPRSRMALVDLRKGLDTGTIRFGAPHQGEKPPWDVAIMKYITKQLDTEELPTYGKDRADNRGGLEHLADAAVGESTNESDGGAAAGPGAPLLKTDAVEEWNPMNAKGYLDYFE